jgi:hypothetical protein
VRRRATSWLLLCRLLVTGSACAGRAGGSDPGTGGSGNPGGGGIGNPGTGGSGNGSGGGSTGLGGAGAVGFDLACSAPAVGRPVLRMLNRSELERTVNDVFPQVMGQWTNSLPAVTVSGYGFDNDSSLTMGTQLAAALRDTAKSVATAVTGTALAQILPCSSTGANRTCATDFINKFGRRLFRRTVTQTERDRYLTFYDAALAKSDFKTAMKWVTVGLIQSPNAIYRREIGTTSGNTRTLTPHELATELAYTYTGTTPSEDLLTQADNGTISDPVATAKTLLATARGKESMQHFFESWLDYPRVASMEKQNIANFATLRADMVQETRAFIDDVIIQKRGGLRELLTATTTNPSTALAQYYGFPAPSANYAAVMRPEGRGIGVLAQGSVLAARAKSNSSSPTERGLLVFLRLLCETKPQLPDVVPPIPEPAPGQVTTRARYETQHGIGGCAFCHKRFDPIGFGFEHFDEGGRYRDNEGGLPINSAAAVPGPNDQPLFQFTGQESLVSGLVQQQIVYQCMSAYLATYAFGTGDACLGAGLTANLQAGTAGVADSFAALAGQPHFSTRQAQ